MIATGVAAGFYTLSATSIDITALPSGVADKLPRYPSVPALLLGRQVRDLRYRGRGIGELLLGDAQSRCLHVLEQLGSIGVVVDAIPGS